MALTVHQKRARNARYQAGFQSRRKAELAALRQEVETLRRQAASRPRAPAAGTTVRPERSVGDWIEGTIDALATRPPIERAKALVHMAGRLGIEVHEDDRQEV